MPRLPPGTVEAALPTGIGDAPERCVAAHHLGQVTSSQASVGESALGSSIIKQLRQESTSLVVRTKHRRFHHDDPYKAGRSC